MLHKHEICPMSKDTCMMLWLPTKAFNPTFLLFKTAPEVTYHLTRGWTKNNEECLLRIGVQDEITVNCYHRRSVRGRLMVKGVEQGLLVGVIGSRTNLAQQPHRGDMVHSGSNWSYPLLGCTVPLLAIQPLGTTRTEKQARWLVFQEYRERQPCFCETIFNTGTKNLKKKVFECLTLVEIPVFTGWNSSGWSIIPTTLMKAMDDKWALRNLSGSLALSHAQASAGIFCSHSPKLQRLWRASSLPSTFFPLQDFRTTLLKPLKYICELAA